jgi:trans-aconitate methyltransferase
MSAGLVYRSSLGYELVMRLLYGRHYGDRLRAVAEHVPAGASVLELCPGPGALYTRHLRRRAGAYTGIDLNQRFVARLRKLGAHAIVLDLSQPSELPEADVVIMQASLYHFLPDANEIVDRMVLAAQLRTIVAEPIRNLASSAIPMLAAASRRTTDAGAGGHAQRFDEDSLDDLMARYADVTLAAFKINGGREKVFVLGPR